MRFRVVSLLALGLSAVLFSACGGLRPHGAPDPSTDPAVVAVYGDQTITLDEFEQRYARTVGGWDEAADDSLSAYRDFLGRYLDFRLKVAAARELGLDRDSSLLSEIATYRTELARPYLQEQEILEPVMRELFDRQQEMIEARHILIRVAPGAAPADTLAAYEMITSLRDSVLAGTDFRALAMRHSQDPSAKRPEGQPGSGGDLGYFSTGRMVGAFEDQAYATPVGDVSPVFRTQFGYHILQVTDRMENVPDVKIAHIMLRPNQSGPDGTAPREFADSLLARLEAGEDFARLAQQYSIHEMSAQRGGELGWLPFAQPMPEAPMFKEAAFGIDEVGGVSSVVETPFGLHIIKLLDRRETDSWEASYDELKQVAARHPRTEAAQRRFAAEARAARGTTIDTTSIAASVAGIAPDSLRAHLQRGTLAAPLDTPVATIGDSTYTLAQVAAFGERGEIPGIGSTAERMLYVVDAFLNDRVMAYEVVALEDTDSEFRRIMMEFREGLLLFRLMEEEVWNAAAQDSLGLRAYYDAHRDQYRYPDRTRIVGFYSPVAEPLEALRADFAAGATLDALTARVAADSLGQLRVDTTFVSGVTNSVFDQALALEAGESTEVLTSQRGRAWLVNDGIDPARPKSFEEARAEIVGQYQQVLEEDLLERLRDEYDVQVFPERLGSAFEEARSASPPATTAAVE